VAPVFQERCVGCHADLAEYAGVLPYASRLAGVLDPADPVHGALADLRPLVATWVGECNLSYFRSDLHAGGILNPADSGFHGVLLAELGWDFAECATCHDTPAAPSCNNCHRDGPTACDTCHGLPPASGAHAAHGDCARCHPTPQAWDDPGHLDDPPAEVTASACVPCHRDADPVWTGGPAQAACGTCHGIPPSNHAPGACTTCHPAEAPHVDGITQLGNGDGTCSACHQEADPGHRSHLEAERLRGPIDCVACHQVPSEIRSPGHIDTAAPAEVKDGACAACHQAASPTWGSLGTDEAACGTCHGIPPAGAPHDPSATLVDCVSCHASTVDAFGNILVVDGRSQHIDGEVDY
jgi:hypothetical protein